MTSTREKCKLHRLEPGVYQYTFGPNEPVLQIKSGDSVTTSTVDASGFDRYGNPLAELQKQKSKITAFQESNPLVGPIWIEEAQPSDLLKISIEKILLNREHTFSSLLPHFGSLTGESIGRDLLFNEPLPQVKYRWELDLGSQMASLNLSKSKLDKISISLHP